MKTKLRVLILLFALGIVAGYTASSSWTPAGYLYRVMHDEGVPLDKLTSVRVYEGTNAWPSDLAALAHGTNVTILLDFQTEGGKVTYTNAEGQVKTAVLGLNVVGYMNVEVPNGLQAPGAAFVK